MRKGSYFVRTNLAALAVSTVLLVASAVYAQTGVADHKAIEYLLSCVEHADLTFIRNGKSYSPKEATAHLKAKYDYFKGDIVTPEDFIRLAGSKSELSGKPYEVQTRDGQRMTSAEWLLRALAEYRAAEDTPVHD
jgi:Family of unknown function (DUF5329)